MYSHIIVIIIKKRWGFSTLIHPPLSDMVLYVDSCRVPISAGEMFSVNSQYYTRLTCIQNNKIILLYNPDPFLVYNIAVFGSKIRITEDSKITTCK